MPSHRDNCPNGHTPKGTGRFVRLLLETLDRPPAGAVILLPDGTTLTAENEARVIREFTCRRCGHKWVTAQLEYVAINGGQDAIWSGDLAGAEMRTSFNPKPVPLLLSEVVGLS